MWAPDSRSIYLEANDGTFGRGEHMFEQPLVRVSVADGRAERLGSGPTVAFSISLSRDGRRHRLQVGGGANDGRRRRASTSRAGARRRSPTSIPRLRDFALGDLKPITWRSFDGMEIWGLLLTPSGTLRGPPAADCSCTSTAVRAAASRYGLFPQFMTSVPQVDPYPTATMAGRGLRGAVSDAARRRRIRRSRAARDRQRLGRGRLQGHHGRRRSR